jgi:hypothetical protein
MSANRSKNTDIKIGMRFSNCVVTAFDYRIENAAGKKTRKRVAVCKCDCGEEFTAFFYRLRKGTTSSCGPCKNKLNGSRKIIDLKGKRFERLVVKKKLQSNSEGKARWLCVCDCGNEIETTGSLLRSNQTKSCGCLSRDNARAKRTKLEGRQFGLLTVNEYLGEGRYLCKCDCGTDVIKPSQGLVERTATFDCGSPVCRAEPEYVGPILSLNDARLNDLKHYSDGKRCAKGHLGMKLVSTMGCSTCHRVTGKKYAIENSEKQREYDREYSKSTKAKSRRNKQLKHRREIDLPYRFAELIRSRLRKVLKNINVKKPPIGSRLRPLFDDIEVVLSQQSLTSEDIVDGKYELDHIRPLASFPWSQSITANSLIELEANSSKNLQFLTTEEHKNKTLEDSKEYGWDGNNKVYADHSDMLLRQIKSGEALPKFLKGYEQQILIELMEACEEQD